VDEIFHRHSAVYVAGVETEEDSSEGGEGAHQVCFECDWRFDPIYIAWYGEDYTSSGHVGQMEDEG
jgi:hypothetical protein